MAMASIAMLNSGKLTVCCKEGMAIEIDLASY
jgi:hypothetical protein